MPRKKPLTASEMGRKGGRARWRGIPAEERSEAMRRAIWYRWHKVKKEKKP